jgi:hypothetical protein
MLCLFNHVQREHLLQGLYLCQCSTTILLCPGNFTHFLKKFPSVRTVQLTAQNLA